jgi:hypothetical protein
MTKFTSQFSYIININECVPESVEWLSACVEKSNTYIITSLALLLPELIWYNALKICLVVVAVGIIKIATSRNNNGTYRQHINKPIMRQRQEQHQATNVLIQTNGEELVIITSRSSTSTPTTTGRRETKNKPTTSIPTTSKGANSRRTSISFMRGDDQREDHQRRHTNNVETKAHTKPTKRLQLRNRRHVKAKLRHAK